MPSAASRSSASMQAAWQPPTVTRPTRAPGALRDDRLRHGAGGALNLAVDAVDHLDVLVAVLGVGAEAVVARAAGEVRALRMDARQRAGGDAVAVAVEIAGEGLDLVELLRGQHLAAIRPIGVVPRQLRDHPVVHADVEIGQHEHRRLEALGEIERRRRELERLARIAGIEADVAGVAVRRVGAHHQVALLGARRHAGGRPGALHVEDHRRALPRSTPGR